MGPQLVKPPEQLGRQLGADPVVGRPGVGGLGLAPGLGITRIDGRPKPVVGIHAREIEHLAGHHQRHDHVGAAADHGHRCPRPDEEQVPVVAEGGSQVVAGSFEHRHDASAAPDLQRSGNGLAVASICSIRW